MLVMESGNCEICNDSLEMMTTQSTDCTCKRCGYSIKTCLECKELGCPECGGKLLDVREYIEYKDGGNTIVTF